MLYEKARTGVLNKLYLSLLLMIKLHVFLAALLSCGQLAAQSKRDSAGFLNDLRIVRKALNENHPSLYRFTSRQRFDFVYDSLEKQITEKTNPYDFFRLLSKVENMIREGHSYINVSPELSKAGEQKKILPFKVILADDRFIIKESRPDLYKKYVGFEITSINQQSSGKILNKIENSTGLKSGFNNAGLKNVLSFNSNFAFAYYYFVDPSSTFNVGLKSPDGRSMEERVAGFEIDSVYQYPQFPVERKPPFHFEVLPDRKTAVIKITTFAYWIVGYNRSHYLAFFKKCFEQIETSHIENLIIDVRNNRGGDETIAAELLTYLAKINFFVFDYIKLKSLNFDYTNSLSSEKQHSSIRDYIKTDSGYYRYKDRSLEEFKIKKKNHFNGKTFVLANGGSRSAASVFLTLVKTLAIGKIVGHESGGVFGEVDGYNRITFTLPYSHSRVSFPIWTLKIIANDENPKRGVMPDYKVEYTTSEIMSGKDMEMEYVLKLIKN